MKCKLQQAREFKICKKEQQHTKTNENEVF